MVADNTQSCLVDAHVHLYDVFTPLDIVQSASSNFEQLALELDLPPRTPGFLLLTQTPRERPPHKVFADLPSAWRHEVIDDLGTLRLNHTSRADLYVVPGWQTVTSEGLEVLALATKQAPPPDRTVTDTLQAAQQAGGLAVLPWGIGKWTGNRASEIRRLIADTELDDVFLGDIAGRLSLLPRPPLLALAEAAGRKVLAGTDPLPFADETQKIGRFGFRAIFDPNQPTESLKSWLLAAAETPPTAGRGETVWRFFKLQLAIQIKKRLG